MYSIAPKISFACSADSIWIATNRRKMGACTRLAKTASTARSMSASVGGSSTVQLANGGGSGRGTVLNSEKSQARIRYRP